MFAKGNILINWFSRYSIGGTQGIGLYSRDKPFMYTWFDTR